MSPGAGNDRRRRRLNDFRLARVRVNLRRRQFRAVGDPGVTCGIICRRARLCDAAKRSLLQSTANTAESSRKWNVGNGEPSSTRRQC